MIGNGVPVPLAKAVASAVKIFFKDNAVTSNNITQWTFGLNKSEAK